jgi:hypothetical protein
VLITDAVCIAVASTELAFALLTVNSIGKPCFDELVTDPASSTSAYSRTVIVMHPTSLLIAMLICIDEPTNQPEPLLLPPVLPTLATLTSVSSRDSAKSNFNCCTTRYLSSITAPSSSSSIAPSTTSNR